MFDVIKRNGSIQKAKKSKIVDRLTNLCDDLKEIDVLRVADKVFTGLYNKVRTFEIDDLTAETVMYMSNEHPDYAKLASKVAVMKL